MKPRLGWDGFLAKTFRLMSMIMASRNKTLRLLAMFLAALTLSEMSAKAQALHPRYAEMMSAVRAMQAASAVLLAEKRAKGLLPPIADDPNQTGMIGVEYTSMTTAQGDLQSKRTATNPDFAAAFVKLIAGMNLPRDSAVVMMLSGSYVGGNVALLAAVEALGLKPILLASAGTSQWGATEAGLNLFDILALLRERGIIRTHAVAGVLGGTNPYGGGMDAESVKALNASAARDAIPLISGQSIDEAVDQLTLRALEAAGTKPALFINVGAAIVGLGSCLESFTYPPGISRQPISCTDGSKGVIMRFGDLGIPTLHVIDMRLLASDLGLPFDPIPLPEPGNNLAVYGAN